MIILHNTRNKAGCMQPISPMTHYVMCCLQLCCIVVATKLPSVSPHNSIQLTHYSATMVLLQSQPALAGMQLNILKKQDTIIIQELNKATCFSRVMYGFRR